MVSRSKNHQGGCFEFAQGTDFAEGVDEVELLVEEVVEEEPMNCLEKAQKCEVNVGTLSLVAKAKTTTDPRRSGDLENAAAAAGT